jgi:hypothetical protein
MKSCLGCALDRMLVCNQCAGGLSHELKSISSPVSRPAIIRRLEYPLAEVMESLTECAPMERCSSELEVVLDSKF